MKKILLSGLAAILFFSCAAQNRTQPIGSPKTEVKTLGGHSIDSFFVLPKVPTIPEKWQVGMLRYQISDSSLYSYTGHQWLKQGGSGSGGTTNLGATATSNSVTITNDNGTPAVVPLSDGNQAGVVDAFRWNFWNNKLNNVDISVDQSVNKVDVKSSAGGTGVILPVTSSAVGVMTPAMLASLNGKLTTVTSANSITGSGLLGAPIKLVNDQETPGINKVYGTDGTGSKGWKPDPSGGAGSQDAIKITIAQLDAGIGLDSNQVYFVTDKGMTGRFYYSGTVANQTTDNQGGTIVVSADNRQWTREYTQLIDIRWFGGKDDAIISGVTQSGTDNRIPINKALAAARANEIVYVPAGNWYLDSTLVWGTGKANYLVVDGSIYMNGKTFLSVNQTLVAHRLMFNGELYGKTNLGNDNYTSWVNHTGINAASGDNWASLTGTALELNNADKGNYAFNFISGFAKAFSLNGVRVGNNGMQENRIYFNQLRKNRVGIYMTSEQGDTYVDKNLFYGGRISADTAVKIDGNLTTAQGIDKTGAFTANKFFNILIELSNIGIFVDSDARFNKWIGGSIESGITTGVFGPTKVWFNNVARDNSFIGEEYVMNTWFQNGQIGTNTTFSGSSVVSTSSGHTLGTTSIGGAPGRTTIIGGQPLSFTARANVPTFMDAITLGNGRAEDSRTNVFGYAKIDGVDRYLGYKGQFLNVTNQSGDTINMPPNCNYVRMAHASNKIIRINAGDLNIPLNTFVEGFKIEFVGPGKPRFIRGDNNGLAKDSTAFTVPGAIYEMDFRNNGFAFYREDNDGSGSGANIVAGAISSTPNTNGFTYNISTGDFNLTKADSTIGGVIAPGGQNLGPGKRLDSVFTRKMIFQDFGNGFTPLTVFRTQNGLSFNSSGTVNPGSASLTAIEFGSGSNLKDIVFTLGKTGVNAGHFGLNSNDFIFIAEKAAGGFEFKNTLAYNSSFNLSGGNYLGKIFGSGNWLVQTGGVATDAGYKLDVKGTLRVSGIPTFPALASGSVFMVVVNPDGTLGSMTIPAGGSGGTSPLVAGAGTGSPYYYLNPINFGVNPSQSYAWNTYGATGGLSRSLWEFANTSAYPSTPRNNTVAYNLEDLQLTNNLGISYKIVKENTIATVTGLTWHSYDIGLPYFDPTGSKKGDVATSDGNGNDGAHWAQQRSTTRWSMTNTSIVNSTSAISFIGGQKNFAGEDLQPGDIIEMKGSGLLNTTSGGFQNLTWVIAMTGGSVSDVIPFPAGVSNGSIKYCIRIQILTATTAQVEFEMYTATTHYMENYGAITVNPDTFNVNFTGAWAGASNSIVTKFNTGEFKLVPEP